MKTGGPIDSGMLNWRVQIQFWPVEFHVFCQEGGVPDFAFHVVDTYFDKSPNEPVGASVGQLV